MSSEVDSGRAGATAEQLRADIDSGRTRDKVAHSDPAAAPLGTDEEASGIRIDPDLVAQSRRAEAVRSASEVAPSGRSPSSSLIIVLVILGVGLCLLVACYYISNSLKVLGSGAGGT